MKPIAPQSVIALALLAALAAVAHPAELKPPVDPVSLEYQPITDVDPNARYYSVFDLVEDEWLEADASQYYGPRDDYVKSVSESALVASVERLQALVEGSAALAGTANGVLLRGALVAELDTVLVVLQEPDASPMDVDFQRFVPWRSDDEPVISGMVFFQGSPNQMVLRAIEMLEGPAGISVAGDTVHYATIDQAIEVRTVCSRMEDIFAEVRGPRLREASRRLSEIDAGWGNYLETGFSQYPWESLLNSTVTQWIFGEYSWYEPPDDQLVLLHPEPAVLFDIRSRREASSGSAVLVHGLGYIHYFGTERDWFLGASASASFSDDEFGVGYGPTLHFDHVRLGSQVPHVSVSLLWHESDGSDRPAIAVAVDLWRVIGGGGGEALFRSFLKEESGSASESERRQQ